MKPSEVEVERDLAARATEVAAARGETLEDVIHRALRQYVESDPGPQDT